MKTLQQLRKERDKINKELQKIEIQKKKVFDDNLVKHEKEYNNLVKKMSKAYDPEDVVVLKFAGVVIDVYFDCEDNKIYPSDTELTGIPDWFKIFIDTRMDGRYGIDDFYCNHPKVKNKVKELQNRVDKINLDIKSFARKYKFNLDELEMRLFEDAGF